MNFFEGATCGFLVGFALTMWMTLVFSRRAEAAQRRADKATNKAKRLRRALGSCDSEIFKMRDTIRRMREQARHGESWKWAQDED